MKTFSKLKKNKPNKKLLEFFLEHPTGEFYESEVRRKTGASLGATNMHLKRLTNKKILLLAKKGKMNFYRLNKESPFVKQLKITHNLSFPLINSLRNAGKKLGVKIYIYGSAARGEDAEDSDWDILIIGGAKSIDIERYLYGVKKKSRRKIKLYIFTMSEWAKMKKNDPAFYERVEKDKIELV